MLLSSIITLQTIILCNIFINYIFCDYHRLLMYCNVDLIKRTLSIYIFIIIIEEIVINAEKALLNALGITNHYFSIYVFHSGLYYFSNRLYMSELYSILSALIILGLFIFKDQFYFLNGLILHIYYKFFSIIALHFIGRHIIKY